MLLYVKCYFVCLFPVPHRDLQGLSTEELRSLASDMLERQPGLVFDILMMYQNRLGATQPAGVPTFYLRAKTGAIC